MNVHDWAEFIRTGRGKTLKLAQLSDDLTANLGAASNVVHIEHSYVLKVIEKHQLTTDHLPIIDETIDQGAVIQDGTQHLAFFHFDDYRWRRWFRVTLKRCNAQRLIWFNTLHLTDRFQTNSKMRRLPVLRPLKGKGATEAAPNVQGEDSMSLTKLAHPPEGE